MTDTLLGLAAFAVVATSLGLWIRAFRRVEIPENRSGFTAAVSSAALTEALPNKPSKMTLTKSRRVGTLIVISRN